MHIACSAVAHAHAKKTPVVLSMFIHNICLKRNRETTASNLFHASLLRRVVGELHFSKLVVDLK